MEGLITNSDELAYRQQVDYLVSWYDRNNLELNTSKTKEMIVDFRKKKTSVNPLHISGSIIGTVDSFKFLSTVISSELG